MAHDPRLAIEGAQRRIVYLREQRSIIDQHLSAAEADLFAAVDQVLNPPPPHLPPLPADIAMAELIQLRNDTPFGERRSRLNAEIDRRRKKMGAGRAA